MFVFALLLLLLGGGFLVGLIAFLMAGAERREHPWKTWGLEEKTEEKDENRR